MASLQKKGKIFYIVYRIGGRYRWRKVGNNGVDIHTAKRCLKKFENDLALGKYGLKEAEPITLEEYANREYLPWSKANKAPKSFVSEELSCKHLNEYLGDELLSNIDIYLIDKYKTKRKDFVCNRTINIELTCLNQMLNKAVEWGYLNIKPISKIKKEKVEKKTPRFLAEDELKSLLLCATPWLRPFILLAVGTGMRAGELSHLKWSHVDFPNKTIKVAIDEEHTTKGKSERIINMNSATYKCLVYLRDSWINPSTMDELPRQPHQKEYVFCNEDGKPIISFYKSYKKAAKKAGLLDVTVHTLRHTFGSYLAQRGANAFAIKELMGHSDLKTTQIYTHLSDKQRKDAVKLLEE